MKRDIATGAWPKPVEQQVFAAQGLAGQQAAQARLQRKAAFGAVGGHSLERKATRAARGGATLLNCSLTGWHKFPATLFCMSSDFSANTNAFQKGVTRS
jgi:hypothetical protein